MYSEDIIIDSFLEAMKKKEYGFSDINKFFVNTTRDDWEIVEEIKVSPNKSIKGYDTFIGMLNKKPYTIAINEQDGQYSLLKIKNSGKLKRIELKKSFDMKSLSIIDNDTEYRPYVYIYETNKKIYYPYIYKIEDVFNVSITSYLSPNDDINTYINENKNRNYFKSILNDRLLSYKNQSEHYKEIVKKLLKKENINVDDTISVFNSIKANYNEQDITVIEELIEEINLTHYSINNGGDCGSFIFEVQDYVSENKVDSQDCFSLIVKENFYNNDEICEYNFSAKEEYLFDYNYVREAVNTMMLMFSPASK